jgi:hypothetical protein
MKPKTADHQRRAILQAEIRRAIGYMGTRFHDDAVAMLRALRAMLADLDRQPGRSA